MKKRKYAIGIGLEKQELIGIGTVLKGRISCNPILSFIIYLMFWVPAANITQTTVPLHLLLSVAPIIAQPRRPYLPTFKIHNL